MFYIEYEDGYYRFVPKFDQQYCIGASSSVSGSSVNAVSRNNNDIFQKWELITAYGNAESIDDPCQIVKQEIYYRSMSLGLPLDISQTDNTLKVTSDFGPRDLQSSTDHYGIDFKSLTNTGIALDLKSVIAGKVHKKYNHSSSGNYLTLTSPVLRKYTISSGNGNQLYFFFAHLSSYASGIIEGSNVNTGCPIATTGNTGASYGTHLHMSVTTDSGENAYINEYTENVDPLMFYDPALYSAECWLANGLT